MNVWMILIALQEPDLSAPGKALESWFAFMDSRRTAWMSKEPPDVAEWKALRTPEFHARHEKKLAEFRERWKALPKLADTHRVTSTSDGKDGDVLVEVLVKRTVPRYNRETGESKESEEQVPDRWVMSRVEGRWLIREHRQGCIACRASGDCEMCGGSGEAHGEPCRFCGKVKGRCKYCDGTKEQLIGFAPASDEFLVADAERSGALDLSTAKSAAESYLEQSLREQLKESAVARKTWEELLAEYRKRLHPEVVKGVEAAVAKGIERGRERFKDRKLVVESVEEKDGGAKAAVSSTAQMTYEGKPTRERVTFRKVGERWLVDGVSMPCVMCDGAGKCGECAGTGAVTMELPCAGCAGKTCAACGGKGKVARKSDCFLCEKKGTCRACKGEGWAD
jgi:hypothetical protein